MAGYYTSVTNKRWRIPVAWAAALLAFLLTGGALYFWVVQVRAASFDIQLASDIAYILLGLPNAVVGLFLVVRRSENVIGWLMLGAGLGLALASFAGAYGSWAVKSEAITPAALFALWLAQWTWLAPYVTIVPLLLFYPTGQLLSRRWRWVLGLILFGYTVIGVWSAFGSTLIATIASFSIPNPVGFLPPIDRMVNVFVPSILAGSVAAGLVGLGARYRRARGVEQAQMKWLLLAIALFAVVFILAQLSVPGAGLLLNLVSLAIPFAIGLAIVRYRLWDIDVIIRRTTSYAVITTFLGLVYFAAVIFLQNAFSRLTEQGSAAAVVLSTLLIAALFLPVRRRVQEVIDRRFNRTRYDAEKTLEAFAATVRNETDLDALAAELLRVIQETMQPETLSIWLRESPGASDERDPSSSHFMK
jgi:hypothetical protein